MPDNFLSGSLIDGIRAGIPTLLAACAVSLLAACATSPRAAREPSASASTARGERLPDADFRAVGNEPAWHMDIANGEKILLVTDYGEHRYEFPFAKPDSGYDRRTYDITSSGHHLRAVVEVKPCNDSMSGRAFPNTLTVTIDGRKYTGCGGPPS
jgi:putative lipoprotein